MIVDSSAIIAVLADEAERSSLIEKMAGAESCRMSAGSLIEVAAVLTRRRVATTQDLHDLLLATGLTIDPVTEEQSWIGYDAYRRFGIGTGHPARLNFGDCFAYALAKASGEPLLFKGDDFSQTDVLAA